MKLTQMVKCAGCAAKMGPGVLSQVLHTIPKETDPNILVGRESFDDAGVYKLDYNRALVQTLDFFPPIHNDPYKYGRIAATNALSDVYAMGGTPLTAMNIVTFPDNLPYEVLTEILRGGQDAVHEAGAVLVGGHTVTDPELKYGLSVTGIVHPDRIMTNSGAKWGDVIILTKKIGTGILSTMMKKDLLSDIHEEILYKSMSTLNKDASTVAVDMGVKCATDITGFGLLGHLNHICRESNVSIHIEKHTVPVLPGVYQGIENACITGGGKRNKEYLNRYVDWGNSTEEIMDILTDPQSSGGLVVTLPIDKVNTYIEHIPESTVIGYVVDKEEYNITII
jgi:selenide,water dikinase